MLLTGLFPITPSISPFIQPGSPFQGWHHCQGDEALFVNVTKKTAKVQPKCHTSSPLSVLIIEYLLVLGHSLTLGNKEKH